MFRIQFSDSLLRLSPILGLPVSVSCRTFHGQPLFLRVQKRLEANRRAPARYKAHMKYLLSGKLYCGYCEAGMVGESGTGKSGEKHHYYICSTKKRKRSDCNKKIVRKEWLENLVVNETIKHILQPDKVALIAKRCAELSAKENSQNEELKYLPKRKKASII